MAQFVEFIGNHLILATMWVITLGVIIMYHKRNSASSVGPQKVVMMSNRQDAVVVDVRDKKEFDSGHIVDSINIPLAKLKHGVTELKKHKEKPLVGVVKYTDGTVNKGDLIGFRPSSEYEFIIDGKRLYRGW